MATFLIREPRCVFIHIPKTGGSSMRRGAFQENYGQTVFGPIPEDWQDAFSFAFVRNPFDRLASAYRMFTEGMRNTAWKFPEDAKSGLSLGQFLDIVTDEGIIFDERRSTFEEKIRHHAIPQTHPFNRLEDAKFVGRFENLQADFATVCRELGIPAFEFPHWNQTNARPYREYFDEATRQRAEDFYAEDLRQLGYSF